MTNAPDEIPYEPPNGEPVAAPPPPSGTILTSEHVREKTFSSTRFKPGYDEDEVDAFLDEVERTLVHLHDEIATLQDRLAAATSAVPAPSLVKDVPLPPPVVEAASVRGPAGTNEMEEMLRRTLLLAQKTADQAVAEARERADRTLTDARLEATRIVTDARGRAEAAEREAAVRSTAMLSESDTQHRSLESKISALRAFERDYRTRLRGYFELQLRELEGVGAPGGALATRPSSPPVTTAVETAVPEVAPALRSIPAESQPEAADGVRSAAVASFAPPVPGASGVPVPPPIASPAAEEIPDEPGVDGNAGS